MPGKKKPPSKVVLKKRNFAAKGAKNQKAGPMKDKRAGRGGSKDQVGEALRDYE